MPPRRSPPRRLWVDRLNGYNKCPLSWENVSRGTPRNPRQKGTCEMQSSHSLCRLSVAFSDRHAVADAGLLLPATLAEKVGLRALCDEHVDLGDAPGAGNVGVKGMTLIFSALAREDSIDDANMLRAGSTEAVLGCEVRAPPPWAPSCGPSPGGHALQFDAVSRHLRARAWGAGAEPGAQPLTIDLDSTICETYGLKKAGRAGSATPTCGATIPCSPWPQARARSCMPAGGAVPPNTSRGVSRFIAQTVQRVREAGALRETTLAWEQTPASAGTRRGPATEGTCASPSPSRSTNACIRRSPPCRRRPGPPSPTSCLTPEWRNTRST